MSFSNYFLHEGVICLWRKFVKIVPISSLWHDWMLSSHFSGHRWRGWCTAHGRREIEGLWPMKKKKKKNALFPAMRFFIYMGEMRAWNLSMLYNSSQLTDRVKRCGVIYRDGRELQRGKLLRYSSPEGTGQSSES